MLLLISIVVSYWWVSGMVRQVMLAWYCRVISGCFRHFLTSLSTPKPSLCWLTYLSQCSIASCLAQSDQCISIHKRPSSSRHRPACLPDCLSVATPSETLSPGPIPRQTQAGLQPNGIKPVVCCTICTACHSQTRPKGVTWHLFCSFFIVRSLFPQHQSPLLF